MVDKQREFTRLIKGKQLLYIQSTQMDNCRTEANSNEQLYELLSRVCSATTSAMSQLHPQEKKLLESSLKYITDITIENNVVHFNVLIPLSAKLQIDGMPVSYRTYSLSIPVKSGLANDLRAQIKDPDFDKPLMIKKIVDVNPLPPLLDETIDAYRKDQAMLKTIEKNQLREKTAAPVKKVGADGVEVISLSDFLSDKKEEVKTDARESKNVAPEKKSPQATVSNSPLDLKKRFTDSIRELEAQLSSIQGFTKEKADIRSNLNDIKHELIPDDNDELFYKKQNALIECVRQKINYLPQEKTLEGYNQEITSARRDFENTQKNINATLGHTVTKKSVENPLPPQEAILMTPFESISNTMRKIDELDATTKTIDKDISAIFSTMQSELNVIDASMKGAQTLAHAELVKNQKAHEKFDYLNSPAHTKTMQIYMCDKLYNTLLDQLDMWAKNPPLFGESIRYNGKNIKVPKGMAEMLITLNPDAHKPMNKISHFIKRKTNKQNSLNVNKLSLEPDQAEQALSKCQTIASRRLEKGKSLDERLDTLDHTSDQRQANNMRILAAVSHIHAPSLKEPGKIATLANNLDIELSKVPKPIKQASDVTASLKTANSSPKLTH